MDTAATTPQPLSASTVSRQLRKAGVNIIGGDREGLHVHRSLLGEVYVVATHLLDGQAARASKVAEDAAHELGYRVRRSEPAAFYVARSQAGA